MSTRSIALILALIASMLVTSACGGPPDKSKGSDPAGARALQVASKSKRGLSSKQAGYALFHISEPNGDGVWAESPYGSEVLLAKIDVDAPGGENVLLQSRTSPSEAWSTGTSCAARDCLEKAESGFGVKRYRLWVDGAAIGS